ncbi:hypothetical protein K0M31_015989 [Melipona bicolor]|uniref:Uncharacterized protein n=1 Tax=Melipona bicolor TaxID=60889 RepID=A0AA40G6X8_9HYME|nr:hypothetical protein K0M31_015989 [Melipona bicolor]
MVDQRVFSLAVFTQQIDSSYLPTQVRDTSKEKSFPPLITKKQQSLNEKKASPFVTTSPIRRTVTLRKKQKKDGTKDDQIDPETIDLAIEPVKRIFIKNPDIYTIKFEQYKGLLIKAKGNQDIVQLAQSYTNNLSSLIKMLLPQLGKQIH